MRRCVETNSVLTGDVVFVEILILRRISGRIAVMRPGVGESDDRIDLKSTIPPQALTGLIKEAPVVTRQFTPR